MLMDSVPPASMTSAEPERMRSAAIAIDCNPEEQKRLMVKAEASTGKPARRLAMRATFIPCSASGMAQPMMTSSISLGSSAGTFSSAPLMAMAARSSGRVKDSDPLGALPTAVRTLLTMTASLILRLPRVPLNPLNGIVFNRTGAKAPALNFLFHRVEARFFYRKPLKQSDTTYFSSLGCRQRHPCTTFEVVDDGGFFDVRVSHTVVIEGAVGLVDDCLADAVWRRWIDASSLAKQVGFIVRVGGVGVELRRHLGGLRGGAVPVDEQRCGFILRAKRGPVGGTFFAKCSVDDVLRAVGFVGLRNQAVALLQVAANGGRDLRKRCWGQHAEGIGLVANVAVQDLLALLRCRNERRGEERNPHDELLHALHDLVSERLSRLQGEGDTFLRFALAAERDEGL